MKEYYYLTELEESPYNLTIADALHLGSTCHLGIYAFITEKVALQSRATGKQELECGVYLELIYTLAGEIEKKFIRTQSPLNGSLDGSTLSHHYRLREAFVTDKYDGSIPVSISFPGEMESDQNLYVYVSYPGPGYSYDSSVDSDYTVTLFDLLCWTDDLEKLADRGWIKRRSDETSTAASNQPDTERQEYPPQLDALILAWRKNWKNADPTDRTACPKKADVVAWLTEQGFSAKNADAGATIIKPQWAIDKGW